MQMQFGTRLFKRVMCAALRFELMTLAVLLVAQRGFGQTTHCDTGSCDCEACQDFLEGCANPLASPLCQPGAPTITPEGQMLPGTEPASPAAPGTAPSITGGDMNALAAPSGEAAVPSPSSLASNVGGAGSDVGIPDMIGDFFGGGYNYAFVGPNATVATAGGDRRFKWSDNNSPFPRNRVFFNYHHFHNALTDAIGRDADLDRYTFGWEKTFLSQLMSLELRVPLGTGVGANPGGTDGVGRETEFGNMSLAIKGLLYRDPTTALAAGMGIVFPTGDDFVVSLDVPPNLFTNEAIHLQPFVGLYRAPTARTFHQFFLQFDFDANGNFVDIAGIQGVLDDATLMFVDYSFGYWIQRDPNARLVRGLAPMVELHYSTTIEDQDYGPFSGFQSSVSGGQIFVEDPRRDVLNITGGLFFQLGRLSTLKVFAVSPLRDGSDKLYDIELGAQFTRLY